MRIDIGGGTKLFFESVGGSLEPDPDELRGKPTLLVLHGGPGSDHSVFRPWFDRFADTHQVVYLDHRGQGRSDERHDPTGWDLDTWADDVVRFCDALAIEQPIVLGQSFGGFVAMHYAGRHPEHPGGLVLSSTAARHHVDATLDAFARVGGAPAREVAARFWSGTATPEEMLRYDEVCTPLYNPRAAAEVAPRRVWTNHRVLVHFVTGEHLTFDLRPSLAAVTCRTLVLAGVDDPVCPVPVFEEMVDVLRGAGADVEAHLFEDCGHGSYRDQPEETERVLRAWLR